MVVKNRSSVAQKNQGLKRRNVKLGEDGEKEVRWQGMIFLMMYDMYVLYCYVSQLLKYESHVSCTYIWF